MLMWTGCRCRKGTLPHPLPNVRRVSHNLCVSTASVATPASPAETYAVPPLLERPQTAGDAMVVCICDPRRQRAPGAGLLVSPWSAPPASRLARAGTKRLRRAWVGAERAHLLW
ncbi:hypothetical protein SEVIR_5G119202v4 [Setaria viridis]